VLLPILLIAECRVNASLVFPNPLFWFTIRSKLAFEGFRHVTDAADDFEQRQRVALNFPFFGESMMIAFDTSAQPASSLAGRPAGCWRVSARTAIPTRRVS
jgi:hypothetical protein